MPSQTDRLINCIAANEEFTPNWPWDPGKPMDCLPWYAVWLGRQVQFMQSVSESDDREFFQYFCSCLNKNQDLDLLNRYLIPRNIESFKAFRQKILTESPEEIAAEKENLFRLYGIWLQDQKELINNSFEEGLIAKALKAEDRNLLRDNLADLGRVITDGRRRADEAKKDYESLSDLIAREIEDLGLDWEPGQTSPEQLVKEINSRIKKKRAECEKLDKQSGATAVPRGFHGDLQSYRNLVHARSELLQGQIQHLGEVQKQLLARSRQLENARNASAEVDRKGQAGLRTTTDLVRGHAEEFAKGKKALDPYLSSTREGAKTEMQQTYAQLMPLLQQIDDLNNKIRMMKDPSGYLADRQEQLDAEKKARQERIEGRKQRLDERRRHVAQYPLPEDAQKGFDAYVENELQDIQREEFDYKELAALQDKQIQLDEEKGKALDAAVKEEERKLSDLYGRKDQFFLRIGYLQQKVDSVKTAYESQIADERQFEEEAKHQLKLLKTIRRVDHALNLYCSWYKDSFPLFLYLGTFVRGDGDIIQSPSKLGKAMDVLTKLPMVGSGLTDIEKCRAYDTGSMNVSLKLGLSLGGDVKGVTATGGLAVEYNAGMSVADDRTFATTAQFALKAAAGVDIAEFYHFGLELEIASWQGGFVFQDHYHWAAWLAARWGHFCARSWACDDYLHRNNLEPDHKPSPKALAELDQLTAQYLSDNEMIQTVWKEIRQYLDYPVIRSEQKEFFSQGKLQMELLGVGLETSGNIRDAHPKIYVMKDNGKGEAVRYEAEYTTRQGGGKLSFGSYSLQITDSDTQGCPITLNDGEIITIRFSPLPAPEVWVTLFDIFLGVISGTGDIATRFGKLLKEVTKWGMQNLLKKYAADYMLGKVKTLEASFYVSQGEPVLQYIRTSVDYGKDFTGKIPVYAFVYIDVGASFHFVRTFGEVLGRNSINYPQYVHYGFKGITRQTQPEEGGKVYTLRPDSMTGQSLWNKWAEAHKNELWHMFMAIGEPNDKTLIRRELATFHNAALTRELLSICEQKRLTGKYQLTGEALIPFVTGFLGSRGQVVVTLGKHAIVEKNKMGFDGISEHYSPILKVFNDLLDDEYRHIRSEEEKSGKFHPVALESGKQKAPEVFDARDSRMLVDTHDSIQLQQETGKCLKSCEKCLRENGNDYELAKDLLLTPIIPEKYWVDDKDSSTCMACGNVIKPGMFHISNKHHCRICGGIFCEKCCPSSTVPFSTSKLRVCGKCMAKVPTMLAAGPKRPLIRTKPAQPVKQQSLMGSVKPSGPAKQSLMSVGQPTTDTGPPPTGSGTKKPGIPEEDGGDRLYTDDHINFLLGHYLRGRTNTYVFHCMDAHHLSGGALKTNLVDAKAEAFAQGNTQMVVPVNIHGNHWVGVYIKFVNPSYNAPKIIHVDPYGNGIATDLSRTLKEVFPGAAKPLESRAGYQHADDKINCGPWTVALLEHMAKTQGELPKLGTIRIERRRAEDYVILRGGV
ncbi:MAG: FYVE zinc finger domain-containing protein [Syntrophobacter sp.]